MLAVCTLTGNRDPQLANLVAGLAAGSRPPDELVVADLGGDARLPADAPFPIRRVVLDTTGGLPLAAARNAAAAATDAGTLVFLDVDCIPSRGLVAGYEDALRRFDGIGMGGVVYLREGTRPVPGDDAAMHAGGDPHPARPLPGTGVTPTDRYELLWSLSFATTRAAWERVGGFCEAYRGYGAEDTDFAFAARAAGVPLAWVGGAVCFHQHHPQCRPPMDRLDAVVANARRFRERWGTWPFEGWLAALGEQGLVRWDPGGELLEVVREPTDAELAAARS